MRISDWSSDVCSSDLSEIDTALQIHRVHAGGHRLHAFANDRLGKHGGGGGAVARDVVGLRGHFAHHLRAHVLELVLKLDFFGDGDAVLGDARRAKAIVEHDIAALGTQCHLHRIGEDIDAAHEALPSVTRKLHVFRSHILFLYFLIDYWSSGLDRKSVG